jgi:excisionase family DNA binding protein
VERLLSVPEAAYRLGISGRKCWQLIQADELPHLRISRRVLVREDSLDAWTRGLEARVTGGPEPTP